MLSAIDFNKALMQGMLGFLLFAGALHVDLGDLAGEKWPVAFLAIFGVLASTALIGTGLHARCRQSATPSRSSGASVRGR